jgi:hypothetical protein
MNLDKPQSREVKDPLLVLASGDHETGVEVSEYGPLHDAVHKIAASGPDTATALLRLLLAIYRAKDFRQTLLLDWSVRFAYLETSHFQGCLEDFIRQIEAGEVSE